MYQQIWLRGGGPRLADPSVGRSISVHSDHAFPGARVAWTLLMEGYAIVWSAVRLAFASACCTSRPTFPADCFWFWSGAPLRRALFDPVLRPGPEPIHRAGCRCEDAMIISILITVCRICLAFTVLVWLPTPFRHHSLSCAAVSQAAERHDGARGITTPTVSVLVPMHNEEKVAADVLQALIECDYDWSRLEIIAMTTARRPDGRDHRRVCRQAPHDQGAATRSQGEGGKGQP